MFAEDLLFLAPERDFLAEAKGQFARQALICCVEEPHFLGRDEFLAKILAAARLDLKQDALLADIPENEPIALLRAAQKRHAEKVLVFGIPPAQTGLNLRVALYEPFQFGGATFLFSEKLSLLEPDRDRKAKLWNALKIMFL